MTDFVQPSKRLAAGLAALAVVAGSYLAFRRVAGHEQAPSVRYTLLNGQTFSTDQLRGKVVLVNFWATSCTTCVHEMPQIVASHEKFKRRGYETLAVSMSYDPPAYVIDFAQTRKLPFGVAIDNTGAIARSFGNVQFTPTSVLIDKHGQIVKRFVGEPNFTQLDKLVEKLLGDA